MRLLTFPSTSLTSLSPVINALINASSKAVRAALLVPVLVIASSSTCVVNALMPTASVSAADTSGKPVKNYSLWLLPPENKSAAIKGQIATLAENRGPTFIPHVTVVGGIKCGSDKEAIQVASRLQESLKGFGSIPCEFKSTPRCCGVWSQALCLELEMSDNFLKLCQKSRDIIDLDGRLLSKALSFPPPIGLPHLSLFYGVANIPHKDEVQPVGPYHAYMMALWQTDPPTLDGVSKWKEISVIDLR